MCVRERERVAEVGCLGVRTRLVMQTFVPAIHCIGVQDHKQT